MNKFLWIALIIFAAPIFLFAQSETKKSEQWQTFAPFGEEFSAEIPASMTINGRGEKSRSYKAELENTYFFIFTDSLKDSFYVKEISGFAKNYKTSKSVSAVGDFSGEKINFADDEGFYHTILIVETKNRAYVFQITSETENNPLVEQFFANLQLNRTIEKTTADSEDNNASSVKEKTVPNTDIVFGEGLATGSGTGSGSGNGVGSGTSNAKTQPQANQTNPLKILSKPRVSYTDWARFYQITGNIPLRVTFLANGNIGAVTAVKKLPFGLTNNAISAARSILFEPAMKDGTAYNVTKLVEYSFMIF